MPGRRSAGRVPAERPTAPLPGFKLALPLVSADGSRVGFSGVVIGRALAYGVTADAECAQGGRHRRPSRWCDCGFYCLHSLADARALACDPEYHQTVVLEVMASGRYIRYERGLRYARQRVTAVQLDRCGCGRPARTFAETGDGIVGWRRLVPVCPSCVGSRPELATTRFAALLGGPPVRAADLVQNAEPGPDALDARDRAALVPVLSAEVTLLQARLDEVQRQLDRLTEVP
jgi:hypothetical protein